MNFFIKKRKLIALVASSGHESGEGRVGGEPSGLPVRRWGLLMARRPVGGGFLVFSFFYPTD